MRTALPPTRKYRTTSTAKAVAAVVAVAAAALVAVPAVKEDAVVIKGKRLADERKFSDFRFPFETVFRFHISHFRLTK